MKRTLAFALLCLTGCAAFAQTSIDKPAATVQLIRPEVISVRQFKADVAKLEASSHSKLTEDQRLQFLNSEIDSRLFLQYCEREKIIVSDAEINNALSQMKASLGANASDAQLESALRAQGVFLDARSYVRQQLLLQSYIKTRHASELKSIKEPSADEVLKAYDLHKSELIRPDMVRASVIFIDYRTMDAAQKKKGADAMKSMAAAIKSNPARFDEYMLKAGDSGSVYKATQNFYVGKTSQYVQIYGDDFVNRVFQLKTGDVSGLIETKDKDESVGLQIVRVNEILPQKQLTLSDTLPNNPQATVQDYLKYSLLQQQQQTVLSKIQKDLVDQLHKEGKIKIYQENLNF